MMILHILTIPANRDSDHVEVSKSQEDQEEVLLALSYFCFSVYMHVFHFKSIKAYFKGLNWLISVMWAITVDMAWFT